MHTSSPDAPRTGKRPRLVLGLVVIAVLAALGWMTLRVGTPFPPRAIVMATGPEGVAFAEFGDAYRRILAREGIELRVEATAGGPANLERLRDPRSGVAVAFVEGGLTTADGSPDLRSLGTVALEPLWVFLRGAPQGTVSERLTGRRIAVGPEGSASRALARRFLELNGVDESRVALLGLTPEESADALRRGEIDGAIMLTSWHAPALRTLLSADGVVLQSFARADAYVAMFPILTKVLLPAGAADLARNVPAADAQLIAVKASLLIRRDLHPALQYVLLQAAAEIHGGPDIFHAAARFPSPEAIDLPLSDPAREFYASGRPFAYRHLPFWLAGLAESLLIVLVPLLAVVYPVGRFLPAAYAFVIERRIYRMYGELKFIERELETSGPSDAVHAELEALASRATHIKVPLPFAQRLFILRSHIAQAQQDVAKRRAAASGDAPPVSTAP